MGKNDGQAVPRIYFTKDEARAIGMGLSNVIDGIKKVITDPRYPWTAEAKKIQLDILKNCTSAADKLYKFTGVKAVIRDYEEGDEDEFLTK